MTLTSATVEALVLAATPGLWREPADLLRRAAGEKLRVVLASAWQSEGRPLDGPVAAEVDAWRAALEDYRRTVADLQSAVPGIAPVKGLELASLYPEGWVRDARDVDLVAVNVPVVWQAAAHLREHGWRVGPASLVRVGGEVGISVVMAGETLHPLTCGRPSVELSSVAFAGDGGAIPARLRLPAALPRAARQLVALAEEQHQRALVARDALDAALAWSALPPGEEGALWACLDELALWPEWCRLAAQARPLAGAPLVPPDAGPRRARAVVRRRAAAVAALRRRGFVAARAVAALERRGDRARLVAERIHRRVPPGAALEAQLPLHGVWLTETAHERGLGVVATEDGRVAARTPVGDAVFTYAARPGIGWLTHA